MTRCQARNVGHARAGGVLSGGVLLGRAPVGRPQRHAGAAKRPPRRPPPPMKSRALSLHLARCGRQRAGSAASPGRTRRHQQSAATRGQPAADAAPALGAGSHCEALRQRRAGSRLPLRQPCALGAAIERRREPGPLGTQPERGMQRQRQAIPFHSIPFHSIPFHSIPFHSIPFHSIPFHSIPFAPAQPRRPPTPRTCRVPGGAARRSRSGCIVSMPRQPPRKYSSATAPGKMPPLGPLMSMAPGAPGARLAAGAALFRAASGRAGPPPRQQPQPPPCAQLPPQGCSLLSGGQPASHSSQGPMCPCEPRVGRKPAAAS
jgi:hypothetical protein